MSKYLNILHNLKPIEGDFELFPNIYDDEFIGTTFSVSPDYISKNLKSFKKIRLIIGIKNDDYQSKTINRIHHDENIKNIINLKAIDFINGLDSETQDRLLTKRIEIKSPIYPIHSKFFILSNKDKSKTRVIIGSANLTTQALNINIPQFEELLVFDDNKEIFDLYLNRFNELNNHTTDFITSKMKQEIKKSKNKLSDSSSINIISHSNETELSIKSEEINKLEKPVFIHLNNEQKRFFVNDSIAELHDSLENSITQKILPDNTLFQIQEEIPHITDNLTKNKVDDEKTYKLIKN